LKVADSSPPMFAKRPIMLASVASSHISAGSRGTTKDVVPATDDLLRKLLEDGGPAKVMVVGNSAGAGLGLATANGSETPDIANRTDGCRSRPG
jgi:alpha-beta hydrolase superfamily lysophospholipase